MLERQILKYLYSNYPLAIFMILLLSAMQSSVVLNDENVGKIFYWFFGLFILQGLRFLDYYNYRWRYQSEIYSIYEMFRNFRLGAIFTGVFLGAFPVLVIDTVTITDMVFIAFVFAGITAASITSLGVDRLSLTLFLATSLLPLLFCFFSIGGYMPNIMASMIFLFMIYLIVNGNRFRKQIVANVELTSEALQGKKALLNRQLISELIVEIQTAYLDKQLTLKLFDNVLEEIINLSGVQYGFICQVEQRSAYELSSKVLVNLGGLNLTQLNGDALKVDELNLRPLSLEAYISQVIISRKNIEVDHIEVFEGEPRTMVIGNLFGIPLLANGKVIAVIGFVDLYDTNLEERIVFLNPLFQTIERILSNFSYGELERALEGGLDK